jgi:hypothetical protein
VDWGVVPAVAPAVVSDAEREVAAGRAARVSEEAENACVRIAATLLLTRSGRLVMIWNVPDAEPK